MAQPYRTLANLLHMGLGCLVAESACASFETAISGGSSAFHHTNVVGEADVYDNKLGFRGFVGNAQNRAQSGFVQSQASGNFEWLAFDGSLIATHATSSFANATAIADNGLVLASAVARVSAPQLAVDVRPGTTDFYYDKPVFNTRADSSAFAQTNTRTRVTGNLAATGTVTFNGIVHGQVIDNGQVTVDPFHPLSRRSSVAGARFSFSAGLGQVGQDCGQVGCPGGNVVFNFGNQTDFESGYSTLNNGDYARPFSLTVAVTEGLELQTFLQLSVVAVNGAAAVFTNTARITDITVSDGLGLDASDGLIAFDGTRYTFLQTLAAPVPETPAALLMALGLVATGACARRRRSSC